MIEPLDKDEFMKNMQASENAGAYSEDAVDRFYRWMYGDQEGVVQVCAFPVPPEDKDKSDMGPGKWIHARTYNEFQDFCHTHSGLWRYHVYSGVNTLDETPREGRGGVSDISAVKKLSFDIETARSSYQGSTKEEVWWTYQYALAQIKYISEEYGAWPLVVMSENGIHLHYSVDFDCTDELLHNRQHLYSKYITQKAMDSKYVNIIKDKSPDHIEFDQDDVSDPARVMKIAGTQGIKSENGRLCGIIHQPSSDTAGTIRGEDIGASPEQLSELFDDSSNAEASQSSSTKVESVDVAPSKLSEELKRKVKGLVRNDPSFKQFWEGDSSGYDSRSEFEFAFVIKMLDRGLSKEEIVDVMWASGMTKWDEESDHYRQKTIENAIEYFDGSTTKDSRNGSFSFSDR